MKKYIRKFYLSIMLVVLSLLTMVATTYAWVGLLTNSTFDEFTINLQQNDSPDASEYGIELSLDGTNFSDSIDQTELRRHLLYNIDPENKFSNILTKDSNGKYVVNDNKVNDDFRKTRIQTCTTTTQGSGASKRLGTFTNLAGETTKKYFKFDLYVAIYKIGVDDGQSDKELDLYLRNSILTSATTNNPTGVYQYKLFNPVKYPNSSIEYNGKQILDNGLAGSIQPSTIVKDYVNVDVSTTCRVALEKMKAVDKGHPEQYSFGNFHSGLFIYQNGGYYPTYNQYTGVYDFGGVLPAEYNFARLYYNTIHPENTLGDVPEAVLNRGDVQYADDGIVNHIVDQNDGVTTAKMIRFRIYFWFEGWDSSCFDVIDAKTVTLNLSFSTKSPNEE